MSAYRVGGLGTYLTNFVVWYNTLYIVGGELTCKSQGGDNVAQGRVSTLFTISSIFPLSFKRMRWKRSTKDRKNGAPINLVHL